MIDMPNNPEDVGQIMMSVTPADGMRQAEIHAMRQMGDAVTAQTKLFGEALAANTRSLERAVEKLDEVNERLIRVEAEKYGKLIEDVREEMRGAFRRINDLESTRDQQKGAKALVDWLRATAPWLVAIAAASLAAVGWKDPVG